MKEIKRIDEIKELLLQILEKLEGKKPPIFFPGEWICNKSGDFVDKVKRIDNIHHITTEGLFGWDTNNIRKATQHEIDAEIFDRIKRKATEEQRHWLEKNFKSLDKPI